MKRGDREYARFLNNVAASNKSISMLDFEHHSGIDIIVV